SRVATATPVNDKATGKSFRPLGNAKRPKILDVLRPGVRFLKSIVCPLKVKGALNVRVELKVSNAANPTPDRMNPVLRKVATFCPLVKLSGSLQSCLGLGSR